jgi:hypothetical protein
MMVPVRINWCPETAMGKKIFRWFRKIAVIAIVAFLCTFSTPEYGCPALRHQRSLIVYRAQACFARAVVYFGIPPKWAARVARTDDMVYAVRKRTNAGSTEEITFGAIPVDKVEESGVVDFLDSLFR